MRFVPTIPNILTLIRMALVPVFIALYFCGMPIWAFCAYLTASLTDFLDGYLARRLNQITSFGKLMDPAADKLMQLSMLFCLTYTKHLPVWALAVLLGKELIMISAGWYLLKKRNVVVRANWSGKYMTLFLHCIRIRKTQGICIV